MRLFAAVISLLIPSDPGGNYDLVGRLVARHLPKHLPGQPVIVPQNMPGAGGLIVANHLYNVAPRDGSVVGLVQGSVVQDQALGTPNVRFDAARFSWIGTPTRRGGVTVLWHTAKPPILFGASNVRHVAYGKFAGYEVIKGYRTAVDIVLAMGRREIDAMNVFAWSEWAIHRPEWVRDRLIVPAPAPPPSPPLDFLMAGDALGRPLAAPPGAPIDELTTAYRKMVADPTFLADALKLGLDVEPVIGEGLSSLVREVLATPRPTIDAVNAVIK